MAARMAFMPPSLRMDSVEKLVCAPVPAQQHPLQPQSHAMASLTQ